MTGGETYLGKYLEYTSSYGVIGLEIRTESRGSGAVLLGDQTSYGSCGLFIAAKATVVWTGTYHGIAIHSPLETGAISTTVAIALVDDAIWAGTTGFDYGIDMKDTTLASTGTGINIASAATYGIVISGTMATGGLTLSGTMTLDGILISGACGDNAIEITGVCTGSAITITGDADDITSSWTYNAIRGMPGSTVTANVTSGIAILIDQTLTGTLSADAIGLQVALEDIVATDTLNLAANKKIIGTAISVMIFRTTPSSTLNGHIYGMEITMGVGNETLETGQELAFINMENHSWGTSFPTSVFCVWDHGSGFQSHIKYFFTVPYGYGITAIGNATGDYWISNKQCVASQALGAADTDNLYNDAALQVSIGGVDYFIPLYNSTA